MGLTAMDELMPRWHFREHHRVRVPAPTPVVMRAALEVTWAEAPLARLLMRATRADVAAHRQIVGDFLGGRDKMVAETDDEYLFVSIDSLDDNAPRPTGDFAGFTAPGYLKMAINLRHADGWLSTETRVRATDGATRRRFGLYWALIRPGSGLTRVSMLRGIRSRAVGSADE